MKLVFSFMLALFMLGSVFGGTPRSYFQSCILSDGSMPPVENTSQTSSPDYIVRATILETAETLGTDMGTPPSDIRIFKYGNGTTVPYQTRAYVQLGAFPTQWQTGQTLSIYVKYLPNQEEATWQMSIPAGSATIIITEPQIIPPYPVITDNWYYTLIVNGPDGYFVTGPQSDYLPYTATDYDGTMSNSLIGAYTVSAPPAGFHWVQNPILVNESDFQPNKTDYYYSAAIVFILEQDISYTLSVTSTPTEGFGVYRDGVSVSQITNCQLVAQNVSELVGTYTLETPPTGYHWEPGEYIVNAGDFSGSKTDYSYSINFSLVANNTFDYPEGVPVDLAEGIIITVFGGSANNNPGGDFPNLYPYYEPIYQNTITLIGAGPWLITFVTTAPLAGWYSFIQGNWIILPNTSGVISMEVPAGGRDVFNFPFMLGDEYQPVELSSFTAVQTSQGFVKLTWVSEYETGLLGYWLYRSETNNQANAVSITPSLVPATNTSTTQTYSVFDPEVNIGSTYYYWLESVDMGHSQFHGPVSVTITPDVPPPPTQIHFGRAYPNPCSNSFSIDYSVISNCQVRILLLNSQNQVVRDFQPSTLSEGYYHQSVYVNDLPNGLYRVYAWIIHGTEKKYMYGDVLVQNP